MNFFGKIWIQNVRNIDLKMIFSIENKINSLLLKGKISWRHGNTWANNIGHNSIYVIKFG